ncbi:hypothetical protein J7J69_06440 [candidate division WOR-3 bacterium]|nr:hypothetical protein [candidate division WOR-3 bacterium]
MPNLDEKVLDNLNRCIEDSPGYALSDHIMEGGEHDGACRILMISCDIFLPLKFGCPNFVRTNKQTKRR